MSTAGAIAMPIEDVSIDLRYVDADQVDHVWNNIYQLLEPACDETMTLRDIYEAISERKALVWLVLEHDEPLAVAVTREHERAGNRWLDVWAIGGRDWNKWAAILQYELERHAQATGCDAITAHVRRGLTKWLARLGWRERQVHMEYRIDG